MACESYEYPIDPTFCDDWCRATMRADCEGDQPDVCVRDCNTLDVAKNCRQLEQELLDCYAEKQAADFSCFAEGEEDPKSTPNAGVCEAEKQAFDDCQNADFTDCQDRCAKLVAEAQSAFEEASDDPQGWSCGSLRTDCECACFSILLLGVPSTPSFFECLGSSIEKSCTLAEGEFELAGPSCKPAGIFEGCINELGGT